MNSSYLLIVIGKFKLCWNFCWISVSLLELLLKRCCPSFTSSSGFHLLNKRIDNISDALLTVLVMNSSYLLSVRGKFKLCWNFCRIYVGTTCERLVNVTYKLAYIWFKVKLDIVRFSFIIWETENLWVKCRAFWKTLEYFLNFFEKVKFAPDSKEHFI